MSWCEAAPGGSVLTVRVVPRASKSEVAGETDDALRIRLKAPPVEGKANRALIEFLADRLVVSKRDIGLTGGLRSRTKRVHVRGPAPAETARRLRRQG